MRSGAFKPRSQRAQRSGSCAVAAVIHVAFKIAGIGETSMSRSDSPIRLPQSSKANNARLGVRANIAPNMMARMVMICVPTLGTCAKPAQVHVAIWDEHHGANVARRRADCPNIVQPDFAAVRSKRSLFGYGRNLNILS